MRTFFLTIGLCCAFIVVSSCGGDQQADVKRARTLRLWQFWSDASQRIVLDSLINAFEREHACTVEVTNLLWNDGKSKLQAAFNSGAPPDVVELGSDWIAQFSSAGVLHALPSDSAGIARFVPYAMPPAMWNRKVFAYPWTIDTRVLYVNTTIVPSAHKAGTSLDLAAMLRLAQSAQAAGHVGIGVNGADRHRLYKKILPMMWSYGGDVFDAQGRPALSSPQNVQALSMYADLARVGMVETQRQLDAAFLQGSVAFWNSGSWLLPKLAGTKRSDYAILPFPGVNGQPGVSFAGGEYLAVSAKSHNVDLATKLVQYLTNGVQSSAFCARVLEAGFPADKEFIEDERIMRDSHRSAFARQLRSARMTPVHPRWLDIEEVLEDAVVRVLYGELTPTQALEQAQQEVTQIVSAP